LFQYWFSWFSNQSILSVVVRRKSYVPAIIIDQERGVKVYLIINISCPSEWRSAFQKAAAAFILILIKFVAFNCETLTPTRFTCKAPLSAISKRRERVMDHICEHFRHENRRSIRANPTKNSLLSIHWQEIAITCAFSIEINYKNNISRILLEKSIWTLLLSTRLIHYRNLTSFSVLNSNVAQ